MLNIITVSTLIISSLFGGIGMEVTTDSGLKYTDE